MKRMAVFIIFILLLAQVSSVAHAIADSFHVDDTINIINSDTPTESSNNLLDNINCTDKCHGHSHLYINTPVIKPLFIQKINIQKHDEKFKGFIHEPESPPPNFL